MSRLVFCVQSCCLPFGVCSRICGDTAVIATIGIIGEGVSFVENPKANNGHVITSNNRRIQQPFVGIPSKEYPNATLHTHLYCFRCRQLHCATNLKRLRRRYRRETFRFRRQLHPVRARLVLVGDDAMCFFYVDLNGILNRFFCIVCQGCRIL